MEALNIDNSKRLARNLLPRNHAIPGSASYYLSGYATSLSWDYIQNLFKKCMEVRDVAASRHVESLIIFHGMDSFTFCSDHLIRLYGSCACIPQMDAVFSRISQPTCYTWTAIISVHADLGKLDTAFRLFEKMLSSGSIPNKCLLLYVLKVCSSGLYSCLGELLYDQIIRVQLESDICLGSLLIKVYGERGCLREAHWIFDHFSHRDEILWSAMAAVYAENGEYGLAVNLLDQMLLDGKSPDSVMFFPLLKVCNTRKSLKEGQSTHNLLILYGLESDISIRSSLVSMYAKCECLDAAQSIFSKLDCQNKISWNSLIAGYAQCGILAIDLFDEMQKGGFAVDKVTFLSVLKSCRAVKAVKHGIEMHAQLVLYGLDDDEIIVSTLIGMYGQCGRLKEADYLFCTMPNKDVVVWGEMVAGYAQAGQGVLALDTFEKMQEVGTSPNKMTFIGALKACMTEGDINYGRHIHEQILMHGLEIDDIVRSTLVDFYAKCLKLDDACIIFDKLSCQDVIAWGTLIAAYVGHDNVVVFELFKKMQQQDVRADKFIYICIIRVCNAEGALLQGQLVHTLLIEGNLRLDKDVLKVLIDMYAMCGCISDACRVFESSSYQDALSWGVLISACVEGGHSQLAFRSFTKMQELGLTPDGATIACILKACGCNDDILQSKLIHHHLISEDDYLDSKIGNILISTYFKCGLLREAAYVFEQVPNLTVTSWDSIISGYSRNGYGFQALEYFQKMQAQGTAPGPSTFACALKSCGIEQLSCQGRLLHDQIVRNGIEKNLVVGNSLVDMYANCGGFSDAQNVFMNMTLKDKISWGAILSCNSICGNLSNVLELYSEMRTDGIQLDNVTASYVIKTCSITGLTKLGRLIHDQVIRYGIETDVVVGTALVDMYAKFSSPKEAQQTCGKIQDVNEIACTALLSAFAQDNQIHLIKGLINDLETEGFVPDTHTHRSIATTLTHSGRSNETNQYIEDIIEGSVIKPATNHFNYVVDSLSRIGQLQKAAELLLTMPLPPDVTGWVSLLTACQMFGNTDVGLECLDNVAKLNCSGTGSFVMIAQMYADAQKWTKVSNILDIRKNVGAWKIPGQAWLEVIDGIHRFSTGDSLSPQTEVLSYKVVRRKMREQGFIPQLNLVMEFTAKYDANEAVFSDSRFTQDEVS